MTSRHQSWPVRWMQPQLRGRHYQFRPYQMVIVCEMPQCINNQNEPDTAQQFPHGKHTLSLITAASVGYSREALCLFLFWAELRRVGWGWGGRQLWNGCTSLETVYTSKEVTQKKMHDFLRRWGLTQRLHLLISEGLERPRWQTVEFLSLWFLYTVCPDDL